MRSALCQIGFSLAEVFPKSGIMTFFGKVSA